MGRLAQTLAIRVESFVAPHRGCSKVMPTAATSRLGCKYEIPGPFARVGIARLQFRTSAQNVLVGASRQRAAPRSQSTRRRAGARRRVALLRIAATQCPLASCNSRHGATGPNTPDAPVPLSAGNEGQASALWAANHFAVPHKWLLLSSPQPLQMHSWFSF